MRNHKPGKVQIFMTAFLPAVYSGLILLPLVFIVFSSFKPTDAIFSTPWALPRSFDFSIYLELLVKYKLALGLFNSIYYAVASCAVAIGVSLFAAYALVRMKFRTNPFFMGLILMGIMIPVHSELVPLYVMFAKLGLREPRFALTAVYAAFSIPVTTLVLAGYIRSIPVALEESAVMDGSGIIGVLFRIVLPLMRPALATAAIFHILGVWNDFFAALVFINSENDRTLQLAASVFRGSFGANYQYLLGGVVLSMLPSAVFYLLVQDKIIEGVAAGAVKG